MAELKNLTGPVYDIGEAGHHFNQVQKHVEALRYLSAPLYIDERHLYGEQPKSSEKGKDVHGPVYLEGPAPPTQLYSVDFFTFKDRCQKVRFQQTHNQGLRQLLLF